MRDTKHRVKSMREINLTQGQTALVDDADFEWLSKHKWFAKWAPNTQSFYAVRNTVGKSGKQRPIYMARKILSLKRGDKRQSDHRNHITLDNRRCNLRVCSNQQNGMNRQKNRTYTGKNCSSIYRGVSWHKLNKKWQAQIKYNGKKVFLGYFTSETEAAQAYDAAAVQLFGEFAKLNFRKAI